MRTYACVYAGSPWGRWMYPEIWIKSEDPQHNIHNTSRIPKSTKKRNPKIPFVFKDTLTIKILQPLIKPLHPIFHHHVNHPNISYLKDSNLSLELLSLKQEEHICIQPLR